MAEVTFSSKKYYTLSSKKGGIYRWEKGSEDVKVDALVGYIRDVEIHKETPIGHESHFSYKFHLVDTVEDLDNPEAEVSIMAIAEGSYTFERLGNLLLSVDHPGKVMFMAYKSKNITSKSTGIAMKLSGQKVQYKFGERTEDGYKGIPAGDPKSRIQWWRDKIMKEWYSSFFGKDWDGVIHDFGSGSSGGSNESFSSNEDLEIQSGADKLIASMASIKDTREFTEKWGKATEWLSKKNANDGIRKKFLMDAQAILDKIDNTLQLALDGTISTTDLPF